MCASGVRMTSPASDAVPEQMTVVSSQTVVTRALRLGALSNRKIASPMYAAMKAISLGLNSCCGPVLVWRRAEPTA